MKEVNDNGVRKWLVFAGSVGVGLVMLTLYIASIGHTAGTAHARTIVNETEIKGVKKIVRKIEIRQMRVLDKLGIPTAVEDNE